MPGGACSRASRVIVLADDAAERAQFFDRAEDHDMREKLHRISQRALGLFEPDDAERDP